MWSLLLRSIVSPRPYEQFCHPCVRETLFLNSGFFFVLMVSCIENTGVLDKTLAHVHLAYMFWRWDIPLHHKGKNKVHKTSIGFLHSTKECNQQPEMFRTCNDNWRHYQDSLATIYLLHPLGFPIVTSLLRWVRWDF